MPFDFDAVELRDAQRRYRDLTPFLHRLKAAVAQGAISERHDVFLARAPGRLDVMGGISDYSGGRVLQLPIAQACFAAAQWLTDASTVVITSYRQHHDATTWECSTADLNRSIAQGSYREIFAEAHWAGYIAGCLMVLKQEGQLIGEIPGMRILLSSEVPEGKGVSSSACVEVAAMKAIVAALELKIDDLILAALCLTVENRIVGASCGIMDQMTAMMGQESQLMKLLCQPCTLLGHAPLPQGLTVVGVDSGERHSISGSDYTSVRIGAFMGYKILKQAASKELQYLTDLTLEELDTLQDALPERLTGETFLRDYGAHLDEATDVVPERFYSVKCPTVHPIEEMARVEQFCQILESHAPDPGPQLGALMQASHRAYQRLGIDSPWTNTLFNLTLNEAERGIYGGKISGGGSGGTVCILTSTSHLHSALNHITAAFKQETGQKADPFVFSGSSNGAHLFGILHLRADNEV